MNRVELEAYITETYGDDPDYPWMKYPKHEVFRHGNNQKWYALIMDIPKEKLGLQGKGMVSVVNLKCSPVLMGSLLQKAGFFPAYHMSKDKWISVALDGKVPSDEIKMLLAMSYESTAVKVKKRKP